MTKQEAAEELLRGPYEPCPVCVFPDGSTPVGRCGKCDGYARILREDYRTACRELELMTTEFAEDIILEGNFWHGAGPNIEYEKAAAVLNLPGVPMDDSSPTSKTTRDLQYSEDNRCIVYLCRAARAMEEAP